MAKRLGSLTSFVSGIADSRKVGPPYSFGFGRSIDVRSNPSQFTTQPQAVRQSPTIFDDLVMWWTLAGNNNLYGYGDTGSLYRNETADIWVKEHIAPNSRGNGFDYFAEEKSLLYAQNTTLGRRLDADGDGEYYDGFLESEGGEPTNTKSITFLRASSQYAEVADNANLSIVGDISMEAYSKLTTLPGAGEIYTLMSKWTESSNQRSYKFDITTSSAAFGDGRDGPLTISANTVDDPIDANCTGTAGQYTLTVTNLHASFSAIATGDKLLVHQTRGANAGTMQVVTVQSYAGGVVTLQEALTFSPVHTTTLEDFSDTTGRQTAQTAGANKAQVIKLKQYTNVTINTGFDWIPKNWWVYTGGRYQCNLKGGIIAFYANGTVTINGRIYGFSGSHTVGFRGGEGFNLGAWNAQGEGSSGWRWPRNNGNGADLNSDIDRINPNGNGGGATRQGSSASGGNATAGNTGIMDGASGTKNSGLPGLSSGANDLTTMTFGGAAGGSNGNNGYYGGWGGGMAVIFGKTITGSGSVNMDGESMTDASTSFQDDGKSGGAGGSILIKTQTISNISLYARKGTGAAGHGTGRVAGVNGADGRIAVYYSNSYSAITENPTVTTIVDTSLGATTGYVLRLLVSSNGTNSEVYSQDITNDLSIGAWKRWGVTWKASTSTANFYLNGGLLSTQTGALTAIYNSTAKFALNASYDGSGNAENFGNQQMDDARLWNDVRTATELYNNNDRVLTGAEANLIGYWELEGDVTDSQTNVTANNLTAVNTPTYSSDVPFAGVTTRGDEDVSIIATGSTYALGTTLSEGATHRQTFTPTKEPLKSLALNIAAKGTGNWTVVVHDALNRELTSITVANAQLSAGIYEFIFASSSRPVLDSNYHVHVYSSVADGTIVSSGSNDMEGTTGNTGAYLQTFFQILVDDVYHPILSFLNFEAIGNERYLAIYEAGNLYTPHRLTLPAGYRIRSLAYWNEYIAIGTWKGDEITDTDQGKIFLWNGTDDTYSEPIDVPEGGINAMFGEQGTLNIMAGYEGKLLQYIGGPKAQKKTQIPLLEPSTYMEVSPGSMTMWRSILRIGSSFNTDSETIHQGIYGFGRLTEDYPMAMMFDHPLSLGDIQNSSVKIGGVYAAGRSLYVGWQNGNAPGVDKISVTNDPYPTATIELLSADLGRLSKYKLPLIVHVDMLPLVDGQSITLKYRPNREETWKNIITIDQAGVLEARGVIDQRVKEVEIAADIVNTDATVTVLAIHLEAEDEADAINA